MIPNRLRGAVGLKRKAEFRAALAIFRRKMEAGADKAESQFAEGKHTFLKKVDENFSAIYNKNFAQTQPFVQILCLIVERHLPRGNADEKLQGTQGFDSGRYDPSRR